MTNIKVYLIIIIIIELKPFQLINEGPVGGKCVSVTWLYIGRWQK